MNFAEPDPLPESNLSNYTETITQKLKKRDLKITQKKKNIESPNF